MPYSIESTVRDLLGNDTTKAIIEHIYRVSRPTRNSAWHKAWGCLPSRSSPTA